jgi:Pyridoxamine 5'-phosphate oxidase
MIRYPNSTSGSATRGRADALDGDARAVMDHTTVRAHGRPHVTPPVAVWLDGTAHFATAASEQKAVNLTHSPRSGSGHPTSETALPRTRLRPRMDSSSHHREQEQRTANDQEE